MDKTRTSEEEMAAAVNTMSRAVLAAGDAAARDDGESAR